MENNPKISDIEKFASLIPAPVSWVDANGIALGANALLLRAVGATKVVLGKSLYEFYPKDIADSTIKIIKQVIKEKRLVEVEEKVVDVETGKTRWFLASRTPLFDDAGENVIGIICISIDITDRKEKEQLQLENEHQKAKLQEGEIFLKLVQEAVSYIYPRLKQLEKRGPASPKKDKDDYATIAEIERKLNDLMRNCSKTS